MIDLKDIQMVLFDFDDTLCIHNNHGHTPSDEIALEVEVYRGNNPWNKHSKSIHMQGLINECVEREIKIGLMSQVTSFATAVEKIKWVKEMYGVTMENYCVGDKKCKLTMLCILAKAFNINRSSIMIIDDRSDILNESAEEGFIACSPMQVVNYISNK